MISVTQNEHAVIRGDAYRVLDRVADGSCRLLLTSPPYNLRKEYERDHTLSLPEYKAWIKPIVQKAVAKVSQDGSVCWQVGNHVKDGAVFPLDYIFYDIFSDLGLKLRNRIVWRFNFGLHAKRRFSGRYETLLWLTKSDDYQFSIDPVRVKQRYPGKRHSSKKGERAGLPSGNPLGKNPSDFWEFDAHAEFIEQPVWDFPNVKANHVEKTPHPCQFPSELAERCILALTRKGDCVLDPFVGAGTTVIAAEKHSRYGIGIEKSQKYYWIARKRLEAQLNGSLRTRPLGKPTLEPDTSQRVASIPDEWVPKAAE